MGNEIKTMEEFRHWVVVELAIQQTSQRELAKKMNVVYPRLSEAVNGKPSGKKYVVPLIEALGGNKDNFRAII